MKFLRTLHTFYGLGVFALLFALFFPFLLVPIVFPKKFIWIGIINRSWAKALFFFTFLPYRIDVRAKLDPACQYVFAPNHFSYLDIPTMGLNPINSIFVGKSEMERIPLFGFMYSQLHITVDRSSLKSKVNTVKRSLEAVESGKSLVFFPEGGIVSQDPPRMGKFKDGAFRVAIEKQIPVVPVTIPHNWIILPDTKSLLLHRGTIQLIIHEPIDTRGLTMDDLPRLRDAVFGVIDSELKKHEHRQGDTE